MVKMCDVNKSVGIGVCLLLAGVALSACATEGDPTNQTASDAITEVPLANGTKVTFFETTPGALAIGQQTAVGVAPIATGGRSPLEVYQSLAPGQPVPERIAAAPARTSAGPSDQTAREAPVASAAAASSESFTANWFDNNFCQDPNYSFINCHLGNSNGGVTVNLDGTHTDIDEFETTACVNSGEIVLRAWVEGDQTLGVQLHAGDCWTYHWWSGLFNADSIRVSSTILSASANYFLVVKWNH